MDRRTFMKAGLGIVAAAALLPDAHAQDVTSQSPATDLSHRLPQNDDHYLESKSYVEDIPISEYKWASDQAVQAFRKIKYSIRIHWGIYSILAKAGESWPFLDYDYAEKNDYQQLYKSWNPSAFDAEQWAEMFANGGLQMVAFTTKHHEGFSMFDTKTHVNQRVNWGASGGPVLEDCSLSYSIMETPFKRDVVKELCEAARKRKIKIDLYFSHPDWYDADFRPYCFHPVRTPSAPSNGHPYTLIVSERSADETAAMMLRHRQQISELLSNYGQVDAMCLDMWLGPEVWPQLRDTLLHIRTLQPDVMLRARGIGNYGDYYTPERFVPSGKEDSLMPWMVIYPLGSSFSYDPTAANYKGAKWIIDNLVDSIAKGGAFEVAVGPDAQGQFHPEAISQLSEVGAWLKINGDGVYNSVDRDGILWKDGDNIRYTRSEDGRTIYAFALSWPGNQLILSTVVANVRSSVTLLGVDEPLNWRNDSSAGLIINLPSSLQDPATRPVKHVYCFKIVGTTRL